MNRFDFIGEPADHEGDAIAWLENQVADIK
jgi:hypothetical protein